MELEIVNTHTSKSIRLASLERDIARFDIIKVINDK